MRRVVVLVVVVWSHREGKEVELVARCLFYMLRIYQAQIGVTKDLRPVLLSLQKHVRAALQSHKVRAPLSPQPPPPPPRVRSASSSSSSR
jgi:hypothetical protein